ncbi:MATE family efflux transporter [Ramlibacter sp. GTP1]|uniref:MATE family efflux transporter n=2 Tax=Ramlibacter albus TaxID=2079448 RepID=A0A923S4W5_9BURK|nr:MATE family efflux transporter [Ramlibacter albus]
MLHGPVLPVLSRLALPNILAMVAAAATGIAETMYVGLLGRDELAAMALVFPLTMLMQTFSAGAMGGGVSSSIARALGGGHLDAAQGLARHAVVIALAAGMIFALLFVGFGDPLYRLLGARGEVLAQAHRYANVLFPCIVTVWLGNTLISVIRGTGNMHVPSATILVVSVLQIALGAVLSMGLLGVPKLGMAGVALGQVLAYGAAAVWLLVYLTDPRRRVSLSRSGWQLTWLRFREILRVGGLALLSPLQMVVTVLVMTGFIARLGVDALAGYGIGARLEFLAIPIAFGVGVASLPMVGMAIGKGNVARAREVAWVGGALSAGIVGAIGLIVAIWPALWSAMFTSKAEVLHYAALYLRNAGPMYVFFGLGLTLYFASQGAGKVLGPVLAGTLRLVVICIGGWLLTAMNAPEGWYFALVGVGMAAHGLATAASVKATRWGT